MSKRGQAPPSKEQTAIRVLFVAGFGPIVKDNVESRRLYVETLGLDFGDLSEEYLHTEHLEGAKSFALWPLSHAAESCFGKDRWPSGVPTPQAWLEFDVEDVEQTTSILRDRGYRLLVSNRTEPWGQTVTRLLSPEGLLVGVTHTPSLRKNGRSGKA